jgi:hypothetical protein
MVSYLQIPLQCDFKLSILQVDHSRVSRHQWSIGRLYSATQRPADEGQSSRAHNHIVSSHSKTSKPHHVRPSGPEEAPAATPKIFARFFIIPHAHSPIMNGWHRTSALSKVGATPRRHAASDGPILKYQSVSTLRSRPPPADILQLLLGASEFRQPSCAFSCDQSFKSSLNKRRLFEYPGKRECFPKKLVVNVQCSAHMHEYASSIHEKET